MARNSGQCVGPGLHAFGDSIYRVDIHLYYNNVSGFMRFYQSMAQRKVLTENQGNIMIFFFLSFVKYNIFSIEIY